MHNPKVTVMIPTYNQAEYVGQAVRSALNQSYPNLEVIVGDDASTDSTPSIISCIKDKRLKYVRNNVNLGRVANYRNLLYNHASGDYVVNLDGDDYYTDFEFITEAIKLVRKSPDVVMVVARATAKGQGIKWVSEIPSCEEATGLEILLKLPDPRYFMMHMATLYNKKLALSIEAYRADVISSDWEFLYRLALRGKVRYLNRNVGVWRLHKDNETGNSDVRKHFQNLYIWPQIYQDATQFGMNYFKAKYLSSRCIAYTARLATQKIQGVFPSLKLLWLASRSFPLAAVLYLLNYLRVLWEKFKK